jgi:hypothetical protein
VAPISAQGAIDFLNVWIMQIPPPMVFENRSLTIEEGH